MNGFKIALYALAVLSSGTCAIILFRAYARTHVRLLMWSGICFFGLTLNNIALFADLIVFPHIDLRLVRQIPALIGMTFLLYGFICDTD